MDFDAFRVSLPMQDSLQQSNGVAPAAPSLNLDTPTESFIGTSHVKIGASTNVVTLPKGLLKLIDNAQKRIQEKQLDLVLVSRKDADCWQLFTLQGYKYLMEFTKVNPEFTPAQRKFAEKRLAATARHIDLDSQGRFSMKEFLDEKFGEDKEKDKEIVLQGAGSHVKVWSKKDFERAQIAEADLEQTEMKGVMKAVLDV